MRVIRAAQPGDPEESRTTPEPQPPMPERGPAASAASTARWVFVVASVLTAATAVLRCMANPKTTDPWLAGGLVGLAMSVTVTCLLWSIRDALQRIAGAGGGGDRGASLTTGRPQGGGST